MRSVRYIYIEWISNENYQEEYNRWEEANFEFVPYHTKISLTNLSPLEMEIKRGRPFSMGNGLIRDNILSKYSISYLLVTPQNKKEEFMKEFANKIAILIKNDIKDLGISEFEFVSNLFETEKKIDYSSIYYELQNNMANRFEKIK